MSTTQPLANLADMVRERATSRGNATAYEFEGRITSFAGFDVKTNKVANALIAMGVKNGDRIAYLGKNSDLYFELLMGAMKAGVVMAPVNWRLAGPEVAFIVADCKAPVLFVGPEFIAQVRQIKDQLPGVRTVITTEGGAPEWQDFTAWRDAQSGDDPRVPIGHGTSRSSFIRRARQASRKARCCRMRTSSTSCKQAMPRTSRNGTGGRPTTCHWWRCRSSTSAAPAGA